MANGPMIKGHACFSLITMSGRELDFVDSTH